MDEVGRELRETTSAKCPELAGRNPGGAIPVHSWSGVSVSILGGHDPILVQNSPVGLGIVTDRFELVRGFRTSVDAGQDSGQLTDDFGPRRGLDDSGLRPDHYGSAPDRIFGMCIPQNTLPTRSVFSNQSS